MITANNRTQKTHNFTTWKPPPPATSPGNIAMARCPRVAMGRCRGGAGSDWAPGNGNHPPLTITSCDQPVLWDLNCVMNCAKWPSFHDNFIKYMLCYAMNVMNRTWNQPLNHRPLRVGRFWGCHEATKWLDEGVHRAGVLPRVFRGCSLCCELQPVGEGMVRRGNPPWRVVDYGC